MYLMRFITFVLLCFYPLSGAYAAFYFDRSIEYIDADAEWNLQPFDHTITVRFKSVCELSGCQPINGEQRFKFGISQTAPGDSSGEPNLSHPWQYEWFISQITYSVNSNVTGAIPVSNGQWSSEHKIDNVVAVWHTIGITFRFSKFLWNFLPQTGYASIYLIGLDNEDASFNDFVELRLRKNEVRQIKISNLNDITLTGKNDSRPHAATMPFCVYLSDGTDYLLRVNSEYANDNNRFILSNGSESVPYTLDFMYRDGNWQDDLRPGNDVVGKVAGNTDQSCNGGDNAYFRVFLESPPSSAGVYTDTVTVTVTPI